MRTFRQIVLTTGIAGGAVATAHAIIPNSNSWPMIWPVIAGGVAFWLASRQPVPHRLRTGLAAAFVAGIIMGVVAFAMMSVVLVGLVHTVLKPTIAATGAPSGLATSAGLLGLAIVALIDIAAAFIGGVVVLPVRYAQGRHAHG